MKAKIHVSILFLAGFALLFNSCQQSKSNKNDTAEIEDIHLQFGRFEQQLFTIDTGNAESALIELKKMYGDFYNIYTGDTAGPDRIAPVNSEITQGLLIYTQLPFMRDLYVKSQDLYEETTTLEEDLEDALGRLRSHFPELAKNWFVFTYLEEPYFTPYPFRLEGIGVLNDSTAGIALQRYLGADFEGYNYPESNVYDYQRHRMNSGYIARDFVSLVYEEVINPKSLEVENLVSRAIEEGKKLWIIESVLPELDKEIVIGYTRPELDTCRFYEYWIYREFIERELLYESEREMIKNYITYGAKSPIDDHLPGDVGIWLGWQIVREYMMEHPEVSMRELAFLDPQELYQLSGYDPEPPKAKKTQTRHSTNPGDLRNCLSGLHYIAICDPQIELINSIWPVRPAESVGSPPQRPHPKKSL